MKLRIKGNSLRLRLLRHEVAQLVETGRVTETIQFGLTPAEELTYLLEAQSDAHTISAHFAGNKISVVIPVSMARDWAESEMVTLKNEQLIENGSLENNLSILIEKDFVCLERENDPDNTNAFPHPTGKCG